MVHPTCIDQVIIQGADEMTSGFQRAEDILAMRDIGVEESEELPQILHMLVDDGPAAAVGPFQPAEARELLLGAVRDATPALLQLQVRFSVFDGEVQAPKHCRVNVSCFVEHISASNGHVSAALRWKNAALLATSANSQFHLSCRYDAGAAGGAQRAAGGHPGVVDDGGAAGARLRRTPSRTPRPRAVRADRDARPGNVAHRRCIRSCHLVFFRQNSVAHLVCALFEPTEMRAQVQITLAFRHVRLLSFMMWLSFDGGSLQVKPGWLPMEIL